MSQLNGSLIMRTAYLQTRFIAQKLNSSSRIEQNQMQTSQKAKFNNPKQKKSQINFRFDLKNFEFSEVLNQQNYLGEKVFGEIQVSGRMIYSYEIAKRYIHLPR
ncbi:unnamed protein product [Paramecium pentaurelia]|uniref:Uncharacterized protein n=1 Tax=Paramecium pentaurelia TaxID=43138 RepID=A0A8S1YMG3_9CILI|nr:unnamed protein product [Paramecium pentaurelia]